MVDSILFLLFQRHHPTGADKRDFGPRYTLPPCEPLSFTIPHNTVLKFKIPDLPSHSWR